MRQQNPDLFASTQGSITPTLIGGQSIHSPMKTAKASSKTKNMSNWSTAKSRNNSIGDSDEIVYERDLPDAVNASINVTQVPHNSSKVDYGVRFPKPSERLMMERKIMGGKPEVNYNERNTGKSALALSFKLSPIK